MAAEPTLLAAIDPIVPATQVLIGLGLFVGGLLRLAALGGTAQTVLFYFGSWDAARGPVTSQLVYAAVLLALGALAAGRILGADRLIEETAIAERYPRLRSPLG